MTKLIAGVDEAGCGPLAGPVTAAAVILPARHGIDGLADSKSLTVKKRERLAELIKAKAISYAIGQAEPKEIDQLNILQASLLAMQRAVAGLTLVPEQALIDGRNCPSLPCVAKAIIGGDASVEVISAASILAKVARDQDMLQWHNHYPMYHFDQHKGYATKLHLTQLQKHGPCPIHRHSFAPVAKNLKKK